MEDGPVLGGVDVFAGEHGVATRLDPGGPGQANQERHRLVGDPVLGVIEHQIAGPGGQAGGPLGVVGEELAQVPVADVAEMRFKRLPLGRGGEIHVGHCRGGGSGATPTGRSPALRLPQSLLLAGYALVRLFGGMLHLADNTVKAGCLESVRI